MDAQKQADEYAKERAMQKLESPGKVSKKDDDMVQSKAENMVETQTAEQEKEMLNEKKAQKVVKEAEEKGENMGKAAAKKLMKSIKTQSRTESLNQILSLEKKFKSTSQQVEDIIKNFEGVHKEMAEIKQEYIQQIQESQDENKEDHDEQVQISVDSQGLEGIKSMINTKKDQIQHSMISLEQEKVHLNELYLKRVDLDSDQNKDELVQLDKLREHTEKRIQDSTNLCMEDLMWIKKRDMEEEESKKQDLVQESDEEPQDAEDVQLNLDDKLSETTHQKISIKSEQKLLQAKKANHII